MEEAVAHTTRDLAGAFSRAVDVYERALGTHRGALDAYAHLGLRYRLTSGATTAGPAQALEASSQMALESSAAQHHDTTSTSEIGARGPLTARQWEVAILIARGYSNRQIAQELVITDGTAANHVKQIIDRLGAFNRAQIAAWVVARSSSVLMTQAAAAGDERAGAPS
jgi:ATP/maltotriose-dependent transcriptional regulator MalT